MEWQIFRMGSLWMPGCQYSFLILSASPIQAYSAEFQNQLQAANEGVQVGKIQEGEQMLRILDAV